jgi:uncharacterized protein YbjQ (UPF0145 family)
MDDILIVTTNDVPGYEITQVHGEVCGLIVRARNVVAMRFDCNEIAGVMSEVAAYGTAVTIARR